MRFTSALALTKFTTISSGRTYQYIERLITSVSLLTIFYNVHWKMIYFCFTTRQNWQQSSAEKHISPLTSALPLTKILIISIGKTISIIPLQRGDFLLLYHWQNLKIISSGRTSPRSTSTTSSNGSGSRSARRWASRRTGTRRRQTLTARPRRRWPETADSDMRGESFFKTKWPSPASFWVYFRLTITILQ